MQPYQGAAQTIRQGKEAPINLLRQAGMTAVGGGLAAAGSKALNKLVPAIGALINPYVPEDFALKGLTKLDPRFGKLIDSALKNGYSFDDIRAGIGEKIKKSEAAQQNTNKKNLIEQHSPELHSFIEGEIKNGRSPLQAGALAQLGVKGMDFKNIIDKLTKQHKMPWSSILESVYGAEQNGQNPASPPQKQQSNQTQNPASQPQGQVGPGQQALMDILSKINQRLGP